MTLNVIPLTMDNYQEIIHDNENDLVSQGEFRYHEGLRTSTTILYRLAAVTTDGRLVGYGLTATGPFDPTPKQGHFEIRIKVAVDWRKRGLGTTIYKELESFAIQHGANAINACVGDSDSGSLAWAQHHGFETILHTFGSKLDLQGFDSSHFLNGTSLGTRMKFVSLGDYPRTDEWFQRFVEFYYELTEDVPGMQGRRPKVLDLEKAKEEFTVGREWDPQAVIIATVDDVWAALCYLCRNKDGSYYNAMTGVKRQYRGQGLGLAVKCAAIDHALKQGAEVMRTHNASINEPMLAINHKLGFEREGGTLFLLKSLS